MPIYHIVLFKLKPGVTDAQVAELQAAGEGMVGIIPGLKSFQMGPGLASTAHRAKGFNLGLLSILNTEEQVLAYADHPEHLKVHKLRLAIAEDTLAYDMVL